MGARRTYSQTLPRTTRVGLVLHIHNPGKNTEVQCFPEIVHSCPISHRHLTLPISRSQDLKIGCLRRPISKETDNLRNQTSDLSNTETWWKAQSSPETQNRLGRLDLDETSNWFLLRPPGNFGNTEVQKSPLDIFFVSTCLIHQRVT